jgi:hypothetical protein
MLFRLQTVHWHTAAPGAGSGQSVAQWSPEGVRVTIRPTPSVSRLKMAALDRRTMAKHTIRLTPYCVKRILMPSHHPILHSRMFLLNPIVQNPQDNSTIVLAAAENMTKWPPAVSGRPRKASYIKTLRKCPKVAPPGTSRPTRSRATQSPAIWRWRRSPRQVSPGPSNALTE